MSNSQKEFNTSNVFNYELSIKSYQITIHKILHETPKIEQLHDLSLSSIFQNMHNTLQCLFNRSKEQIESKSSISLCIELLKGAINVLDLLIESLEQLFENFIHQTTIDIFINNGNLPVCILQIVYLSYQYCQLSEKLYGSDFSVVSNFLVDLFQKTFNLQKIFSLIFGKYAVSDTTILLVCVDQYVKVGQLIFDITVVVKDIDHTLFGTTWKLLICFLIKCKAVFCKDKTDCIKSFVKEIIENCKSVSSQCKAIVDENKGKAFKDIDFMKSIVMSVRMTSFFLELFNNLVFEYGDSIDVDVNCAIDFIFTITENLLPLYVISSCNSIKAFPSAIRKAVCMYFFKELDRCLRLNLFSLDFQSKILSIDESIKESSVDCNPLVQLILVLRLLKYSNKSDGFNNNVLHIFSLLFQLQDQLYPHFVQKTRCYFDNADGNELLLCEVVSSSLLLYLSDISHEIHFEIEDILLPQILSVNCFNFQLALDIWCHIFRSASVMLQKDHVIRLIEVVSTFNLFDLDFRHLQFGFLVKNLFQHLPISGQQYILRSHPLLSNENLEEWFFLGSCFIEISSDSNKIISDIGCTLRDVARTWLNDGGRLDGLLLLINFLRVATSCLRNIQDDSEHINILFHSCKLEVFDLWKNLPESSEEAPHSLSILYDDLVSLTSSFFQRKLFDQNEISTILQKSRTYLMSSPNVGEWRLHNIVHMLASLRHVTFSQNLLRELVLVWRDALFTVSSSHWLLRHKCLEEFEVFSKSTKHPEIISQICTDTSHPSHSCINSMVKSHLKRDLVQLPSKIDFTLADFDVFERGEITDEMTKLVMNVKNAAEELCCASSSLLSNFDKTILKDAVLKLEQVISRVK